MSVSHLPWNFEAAGFLSGCCAGTLLLVTGCESPQIRGTPSEQAAILQASITSPDVRTHAAILEMENWYIAEKNSQPTHQHLAEAEKREKADEAKRQEEQAAQAAKTAEAAPGKPQ